MVRLSFHRSFQHLFSPLDQLRFQVCICLVKSPQWCFTSGKMPFTFCIFVLPAAFSAVAFQCIFTSQNICYRKGFLSPASCSFLQVRHIFSHKCRTLLGRLYLFTAYALQCHTAFRYLCGYLGISIFEMITASSIPFAFAY